jgi:hypothetical protein
MVGHEVYYCCIAYIDANEGDETAGILELRSGTTNAQDRFEVVKGRKERPYMTRHVFVRTCAILPQDVYFS